MCKTGREEEGGGGRRNEGRGEEKTAPSDNQAPPSEGLFHRCILHITSEIFKQAYILKQSGAAGLIVRRRPAEAAGREVEGNYRRFYINYYERLLMFGGMWNVAARASVCRTSWS